MHFIRVIAASCVIMSAVTPSFGADQGDHAYFSRVAASFVRAGMPLPEETDGHYTALILASFDRAGVPSHVADPADRHYAGLIVESFARAGMPVTRRARDCGY